MEYGRREPIKGASIQEPTAFTMKTIKELLDEDGSAASAEPLMQSTPIAPQPATNLQQPPHLSQAAPVPPAPRPAPAPVAPAAPLETASKVDVFPAIAPEPAVQPTVEQPQEPVKKPRSLFTRLIGG